MALHRAQGIVLDRCAGCRATTPYACYIWTNNADDDMPQSDHKNMASFNMKRSCLYHVCTVGSRYLSFLTTLASVDAHFNFCR